MPNVQSAPNPPSRLSRAKPVLPQPAERRAGANTKKDSSKGLIPGDVNERASEVAQQEKKLRDNNIWRWTTIGISCAGGLASGWLGSNVSDQPNGMFNSGGATIAAKASDTIGSKPPVPLKLASKGQPDKIFGHATGKTDRASQMDENLCTVLELDRGTGLTLAKPCKPVETAEFNSTLGKADLMVAPR